MRSIRASLVLSLLFLAAGALQGCEDSSDGFPTDLSQSTLQTALAGSENVRPACEVLTADAARLLLGEEDELEQQDEGDFCAYAPRGTTDSHVVFELMTPFGEQLFDIESSEVKSKKAVSNVGDKAYRTETDGSTVLWAHRDGVFLRLRVDRPSSDALLERMADFAAGALPE